MKIYLDVFFLVNFLLNLFVFEILNLFQKKKAINMRSVMAAALGALAAVGILLSGIKSCLFIFLLVYVVVSLGMIRIAYGKTSWQGMVAYVVKFYLSAVFLAGGMMYLKELTKQRNLSMVFLLSAAIFLVFVANALLQRRRQGMGNGEHIYRVHITYHGKKVTATGFWDTGNHLYEPISRGNVHVVTYRLFRKLLSEQEKADFSKVMQHKSPESFGKLLLRYIPYHSLGNDKDFILGKEVEDMEIHVGDKKTVHTGKTWLGISDDFLSVDHEYDLLLHSKIFSE